MYNRLRGCGCRAVAAIPRYQSTSSVPQQQPSQAQVVIAGAGVVGNSVAYHLVQRGWRDVLVIEQNRIGSGSSNFGSGTLGLFKPIAMRNLIKASIRLYRQLHEMGFDIGLRQCGSLNLAQTRDRLIALRRRMAYNLPTGLHCELLGPNEIRALHPYVNVDGIEGGVWVPEDAVADPLAICLALAKLAKQGGAIYQEQCSIKRIETRADHVVGVETDRGHIACEYFINCGGMWSRQLGLQCDKPVCIPSYPANHFYAITQGLQLNESDRHDEMLPVLRDYDAHTYMRQLGDEMLVGWFERNARPAFDGGQMVPKSFTHESGRVLLDADDERHCEPLWQKACQRLPILAEAGVPILRNSPNNFTPDGRWVLGETAEVKNYFVAVGMNGNSLQGAGGIGKTVAEWLIQGSPTQELQTFSIQRFLDLHNNRKYLQQRTKEIVGRHYEILYPHQCEYREARKLRCSPLYSVLEERGAVFGIKMAYERALYFDLTYKRGNPLPKMPPGSFYKPAFLEFMREEHNACREGVGIIDISSFSKIEITGTKNENSVLDYLQKMCSNNVNIPVGGISHTGMQNERGGYENDCMLVRQTNETFFMVSPSNQQTRIYQWMSQHLPRDGSVCLNDVTSMYTVINVVGPKSAPLMGELSNSNINLSPFTYKKVNVGYASDVMVMSFTHTGEPGYCLFVPSEYALHVYDRLMTVGRDFGAKPVGTMTQRFMRIEKFIPFWGEEISSFVTPYETGYGHQVKLDKEYFIGKYALQKQKEVGVTKRLVMFHVQDIDPDTEVWPWGGEPFYRNNEFVGNVTSAGISFSKNKLICLGFIQRAVPASQPEAFISAEYILDKSATYQIDIAGRRYPLTPYLHAPAMPEQRVAVSGTPRNAYYKPTVVKSKRLPLTAA